MAFDYKYLHWLFCFVLGFFFCLFQGIRHSERKKLPNKMKVFHIGVKCVKRVKRFFLPLTCRHTLVHQVQSHYSVRQCTRTRFLPPPATTKDHVGRNSKGTGRMRTSGVHADPRYSKLKTGAHYVGTPMQYNVNF